MTIASRIRAGEEVAIFTRNHRSYLDEAAEVSARDPDGKITFRARAKWASAARALAMRAPLPLYIAPIGGAAGVEFAADLWEVVLNPIAGDPATSRLLGSALDSTRNEGLWENSARPVKTLYVITNCRPLERPFPFTHLIKVSDNVPLHDEYRYSYAVVYRRPEGQPDGGGA